MYEAMLERVSSLCDLLPVCGQSWKIHSAYSIVLAFFENRGFKRSNSGNHVDDFYYLVFLQVIQRVRSLWRTFQ